MGDFPLGNAREEDRKDRCYKPSFKQLLKGSNEYHRDQQTILILAILSRRQGETYRKGEEEGLSA